MYYCITKIIIIMAKKVAVLAVNPVNGFGLFQYLEAFFENGISYKVYAVAETKQIKTNSGVELVADDIIAHLVGHEDEFDAVVFSCGDAVPVFAQNADKPYNIDLMSVLKAFGEKGKILIGHCAAGMLFDFAGVTEGKMKAAVARKGFIIQKANGQVIRTVNDLEDVLKAATLSPDQVLFLSGMFPSGKRANYDVDLTQE